MELKHAHGTSAESILSPTVATPGYDVAAWLAAGMTHHVRPFRLSPEAENELAAALRVWTTSPRGLTKGVTRIRPSAQVRSCEPAQNPSACVEAV